MLAIYSSVNVEVWEETKQSVCLICFFGWNESAVDVIIKLSSSPMLRPNCGAATTSA